MTTPSPPSVAVVTGDVLAYSVRNAGEYATIYVRPLATLSSAHGAEVAIASSFGSYAYYWSYMGEDWRSFLSSLDFEYAMGKLAGKHFRVPLEHDQFVAAMRAELDRIEAERVQSGGLRHREAEYLSACHHVLNGEALASVPPAALFHHFNNETEWGAYNLGLYERVTLEQPCPQARGFWDMLWAPFAAHLKAELAAA